MNRIKRRAQPCSAKQILRLSSVSISLLSRLPSAISREEVIKATDYQTDQQEDQDGCAHSQDSQRQSEIQVLHLSLPVEWGEA